jgi:uncharacterized protein YuzE
MPLPVRATYDRGANAAYIYLTDVDSAGSAMQQLVDTPHGKGTIILDFDPKGRLVGIEVLNASKALPLNLLESAERL